MTVRFLVLALLLSLFAAPTAAQAAEGILITQRVTTGGAPITVQVQIEPTRMRTDMAGPGGGNVMIFDGGKQVVYIVDASRKTYMEITKADVERLSAQIQAAMVQMQAQLEKLPPAQRAQMETLMKGGVGAGVQVTRTGSDTVGRWTCNAHDLTLNGQKIGEMCSVNPATLGFGAADFAVMNQLGAFYSGMAPQLAGLLPGVSAMDQPGSSDFPLRTVMMGPGLTTTTEVVEAVRRTFPDSTFAVPDGFAKQDLTALMGGFGQGR